MCVCVPFFLSSDTATVTRNLTHHDKTRERARGGHTNNRSDHRLRRRSRHLHIIYTHNAYIYASCRIIVIIVARYILGVFFFFNFFFFYFRAVCVGTTGFCGKLYAIGILHSMYLFGRSVVTSLRVRIDNRRTGFFLGKKSDYPYRYDA